MNGSTQSQLTSDLAPWKPQDGPESFLELWGINPHSKWPGRFCVLVRLYALYRIVGPDVDAAIQSAHRAALRGAGVSPVIFWARVKAALAPVLTADDETLAAFGLQLYARTIPALGLALSHGLDDLDQESQWQRLLDLLGEVDL